MKVPCMNLCIFVCTIEFLIYILKLCNALSIFFSSVEEMGIYKCRLNVYVADENENCI